MSNNHCLSGLLPAGEAPGHADQPVVKYSTRGRLLILAEDCFSPDWLDALQWPEPVVVMGHRASEIAPRSGFRIEPAEKLELSGWLGRFQLRAGASDQNLAAVASDKPDGRFDLVIDTGSQPLLNQTVKPFGYFTAANRDDFVRALEAASQLFGQFTKPRYFDYNPAICAHHSFGQPGCQRCLDVCGADAIQSTGQQIQVDPYLCQGCGSCTLACPTGALSFVALDRNSLLAEMKGLASALEEGATARTLVVSDGPVTDLYPGRQAHLVIQPLTAFGEELWIAALTLGFDQVVLQATEALESRARELLEQKLADLQRMLPALGLTQTAVTLVGPDQEQNKRPPRTESTGPVQSELTSALEASAQQTKRQFLNAGLDALQSAGGLAQSTSLDPGAPLGEILVDQKRCTLCSSCAKLCPTLAIDYSEREQPGTARLSFLEASCVQCGICVSGCPEQAITLAPRLAAEEVRRQRRVMASSPMAACADCGAQFAAEKLLKRTLQRQAEHGATEAALEQAIRCPRCRAVRVG